MTERPEAEKLPRLSKQNVRRYAEAMAATTTSYGTELDSGTFADRIWKSTRRCLLCGKPTYVFGLYTPGRNTDRVTNVGLGEGQARVFHYGLCVGCSRTESALARVEETIADRMLGGEHAGVLGRDGRSLHERGSPGRVPIRGHGGGTSMTDEPAIRGSPS